MKGTDIVGNLGELLKNAAKETGRDLQINSDELRTYTAQRVAYLATIVGQKGYEEAFLAERDAVCLKAGILATSTADAADQRLIGIITGVLSVGARVAAIA